MGRPKSENPKDAQVKVRLDKETYRLLEENAAYYEENKTESVRRGIRLVNKDIKKNP